MNWKAFRNFFSSLSKYELDLFLKEIKLFQVHIYLVVEINVFEILPTIGASCRVGASVRLLNSKVAGSQVRNPADVLRIWQVGHWQHP